MRSQKIKTLNPYKKAGDSLLVTAKDHNDIIEDLEFLFPKTNQPFNGTIYLGGILTQYEDYTVNSALEVALGDVLTIGGSAEIRMIGDGSTTPTFSANFTASTSSEAYDPTLAAINKVIFYYDGTDAFYSITVL